MIWKTWWCGLCAVVNNFFFSLIRLYPFESSTRWTCSRIEPNYDLLDRLDPPQIREKNRGWDPWSFLSEIANISYSLIMLCEYTYNRRTEIEFGSYISCEVTQQYLSNVPPLKVTSRRQGLKEEFKARSSDSVRVSARRKSCWWR